MYAVTTYGFFTDLPLLSRSFWSFASCLARSFSIFSSLSKSRLFSMSLRSSFCLLMRLKKFLTSSWWRASWEARWRFWSSSLSKSTRTLNSSRVASPLKPVLVIYIGYIYNYICIIDIVAITVKTKNDYVLFSWRQVTNITWYNTIPVCKCRKSARFLR